MCFDFKSTILFLSFQIIILDTKLITAIIIYSALIF